MSAALMLGRRCVRLLAAALLLVSAVRAQEAPPAALSSLDWGPEVGAKLRFRGVVDPELLQGGAAGGMMYPAPSLVGFLAAVLTHAAINESAQRSRLQEIEAKADQVLEPYRPLLERWQSSDLLAAVRARLSEKESGFDDKQVLRLRPLFWITQDHRALIADVVASSGDGAATKTVAMRLVSSPRQVDAQAAWLSDDGAALKTAAIELVAEASLRLQAEMKGRWSVTHTQRTQRYPEGGRERIERVQVLVQECQRALWRTLRGDLLSVPVAHSPACEQAALVVAPPAASAPASGP